MPKLAPTDWKTQLRIFEADGFVVSRVTDRHIVMNKSGIPRPVIIPKYKEVGRDIILNNMRTAGMTRERYFKLL